MLGLLFIYYIGKTFYDLAFDRGKGRLWGYAILGVVIYYIGGFTGTFIVGLGMEISSPGSVDRTNEWVFSLLAIPFGVLACWGLYTYLKKRWGKSEDELVDKLNEMGSLDPNDS